MESIGYYHNYIKIIMICNRVSNLNVSNALLVNFRFLGGSTFTE